MLARAEEVERMGALFSLLWGTVVGSAVGFLVGITTADPEDPRQQAIRDAVSRVYEEARSAAEARERELLAEYRRMTGLEKE